MVAPRVVCWAQQRAAPLAEKKAVLLVAQTETGRAAMRAGRRAAYWAVGLAASKAAHLVVPKVEQRVACWVVRSAIALADSMADVKAVR